MADPISLASGLVALVTFALQSGSLLCKTIESFRTHPKTVRELKEELDALTEVLRSLSSTIEENADIDLSALKLPLLRCGKACNGFQETIAKCSSRSGGSRTSFRDWAKLTYMGDGIDEFRRMLAGYKSTITIALIDANLRKSSTTAESIENYKIIVQEASSDLEDHLQNIDEKLKSIISQTVEESDSDATELRLIQEERSSTEQCLQICAQLSAHIDRVQISPSNRSRRFTGAANPAASAEQVTNKSLQECKDKLDLTVTQLEGLLRSIINRQIAKTTTVASEEGIAELTVLQEELESARRCLDICSGADDRIAKELYNLFERVTVEEDGSQFFISTTGRLIHASDISAGARAVQLGGQLSDISLQQISRDFGRVGREHRAESSSPAPREQPGFVSANAPDGSTLEWNRYGPGLKLSPQLNRDAGSSSGGATK